MAIVGIVRENVAHVSQQDLNWIEIRLALAVHEINMNLRLRELMHNQEQAGRGTTDSAPPVAEPAHTVSTTPPPNTFVQTQQSKTMSSVTGAKSASASLKQLMEQAKQSVTDGMTSVQEGIAKHQQAGAALKNLGTSLNADGDDLLATVGQFTNELG